MLTILTIKGAVILAGLAIAPVFVAIQMRKNGLTPMDLVRYATGR